MMLLGLVEPPTAGALDNDGAADRDAHLRVGIERDAAALQQVVKVLRRCSQVGNGLGIRLDRDVLLGKALARLTNWNGSK